MVGLTNDERCLIHQHGETLEFRKNYEIIVIFQTMSTFEL